MPNATTRGRARCPRLSIVAATLTTLLLQTIALADIRTDRVEYTFRGDTYHGYLAYDAAADDQPRPGVLIFHEWWGLDDYARSRARQLAEAGYVAFAADMYGQGRTTREAGQASEWAGRLYADFDTTRALAAAALQTLAEHDRVDRARLAAIGYCMGGTMALELARSGLPHTNQLKAVVAFHASRIAAANPADNANIAGTVLIAHGAADPLVPADQIPSFQRQMREAGVDYIFIAYSGAVHSFTNPRADEAGIDGVAYQETADRRSWRAMLDLFEETLSEP